MISPTLIAIGGILLVGFAILTIYFKDVADRALNDARFWKEYGDLFKPGGKALTEKYNLCEHCQEELNRVMDKYKVDSIGIKRFEKKE